MTDNKFSAEIIKIGDAIAAMSQKERDELIEYMTTLKIIMFICWAQNYRE